MAVNSLDLSYKSKLNVDTMKKTKLNQNRKPQEFVLMYNHMPSSCHKTGITGYN